jgi:hypothetical protein
MLQIKTFIDMKQKELQEDNFTLQEKIESVMSMLNTPIFKRKIGSEKIIKLIEEICQEMGIRGGI